MYSVKLRKIGKIWITCFIALLLSGCHVMLIGAYDQVTDQGIQKVQADMSTVIVKLEGNFDNNTPDDNKFQNFKDAYDNINGEVETLKIRCQSLPKYKIILDQVNTLNASIMDFEKIHKIGLKDKQVVETSKSLLEISFSAMIALQNGLKRQKNN